MNHSYAYEKQASERFLFQAQESGSIATATLLLTLDNDEVYETGLSTSKGEGGSSSGLDMMTGRLAGNSRGGGETGACSGDSPCETLGSEMKE